MWSEFESPQFTVKSQIPPLYKGKVICVLLLVPVFDVFHVELKEVAETKAAKEVAVAKLEKDAAEFTKQKDILLGEGEAKRKEMVYKADGYTKEKIEAFRDAFTELAEAFKERKVPQVVIGGNGNGNTDQTDMNHFGTGMMLLVMDKLGLDLGIESNNPQGQKAVMK